MFDSQVLAATLPAHERLTEVVPVAISDTEGSTDGVEPLDAILQSLGGALKFNGCVPRGHESRDRYEVRLA